MLARQNIEVEEAEPRKAILKKQCFFVWGDRGKSSRTIRVQNQKKKIFKRMAFAALIPSVVKQ